MTYLPAVTTSDGTGPGVSIPWPLLDNDDLEVLDNGAAFGGTVSFPGGGVANLSPFPAAGHTITLRRDTPVEATKRTFQAGPISANDLNAVLTQILYRLQELPYDPGVKGDPGANVMAVGLATDVATLTIPTGTDLIQTSGYAVVGEGSARYTRVGSEPTHAAKLQSLGGQWWELAEIMVTAAMLGARPNGSDATTPYQNAVTAHVALSVPFWGEGAEYTVSTVSWPSRTRAFAVALKAITRVNSLNNDAKPIFFDGRVSEVSDVRMYGVRVDGNRVGQTGLTSSGTDGQCCGISAWGRVRDIHVDDAYIRNCATDGIFIYGAGVAHASDTDYFAINCRFTNVDIAYSGRHGMSCMGVQGLIVTGRSRLNGQDAPGWTPSGTYTDGGYARRFPANTGGTRYGRGFTWEDGQLGEGFDGITLDLSDCSGNAAGIGFLAQVDPSTGGYVKRKNAHVRVGYATSGGSADYPVQFAQLASYAGTLKTFDGVFVQGSFSGAPLYMEGITHGRVAGTLRRTGGGGFQGHLIVNNIDLGTFGDAIAADYTDIFYGGTFPISVISSAHITASGWTINNNVVSLKRILPNGDVMIKVRHTITPDAAETAALRFACTAGFIITQFSATQAWDNGNAVFRQGGALEDTGTGPNYWVVSFSAQGAIVYIVDVYMTLRKA